MAPFSTVSVPPLLLLLLLVRPFCTEQYSILPSSLHRLNSSTRTASLEGIHLANSFSPGITMDSPANGSNPSDKSMKKIKAIIFDMDGTLLDTESLADKAILKSLFSISSDSTDDLSCLPASLRSKHPYTEWRLEWELKKQILGLRGKEWSPITLNFFRQHCEHELPTTEGLIDSWEQNLNGMCTEIEACEGAKALVGAIILASKRSGGKIPMAIATSSRMSGVEKKRTRHELDFFEHIDAIVTGDDPAVLNGKPAPDIYIEAARRLGVDPTECLVFEDALSGVKSGKSAGCQVVAVPDSRFSDDERQSLFLKEGEADIVLTNLWEFDGRPFGLDFDMKEVSNLQAQKEKY